MDGRTERWTDSWTNEEMDGRTGSRWTDGQMSGGKKAKSRQRALDRKELNEERSGTICQDASRWQLETTRSPGRNFRCNSNCEFMWRLQLERTEEWRCINKARLEGVGHEQDCVFSGSDLFSASLIYSSSFSISLLF